MVAQQTLDDVAERQAGLQSEITDYLAQYAALTAAQQEAVNRAHAGPALEASGRSSGANSPRGLTAPAGGEDGPAVAASSEAAQMAVDTALAHIGDPCVWAAGGPNAFDCSGLTQYAYAAAGVRLPHSSKAQSAMGTAVSRSALQPGDLVFFRSPVSRSGCTSAAAGWCTPRPSGCRCRSPASTWPATPAPAATSDRCRSPRVGSQGAVSGPA